MHLIYFFFTRDDGREYEWQLNINAAIESSVNPNPLFSLITRYSVHQEPSLWNECSRAQHWSFMLHDEQKNAFWPPVAPEWV